MLQSSGRTVEEMNEIFDMLRFDPEIEYKEVEYDAAAH
jgi:hypothetical protein